jgi:arylsulfatase A-like enzyme
VDAYTPNVLVVLYDDTGCAAWSPFGGRIEMPTMQRLADNGLTYSQWHTTALCSPTLLRREVLLCDCHGHNVVYDGSPNSFFPASQGPQAWNDHGS